MDKNLLSCFFLVHSVHVVLAGEMLKTIFRYFHCHFSKLIGKSALSVTFPNIH